MTKNWFEYPVQVQPHHTDYAGIVWHGSYLAWMEEARIAALRRAGIEFSDLVAAGVDLPVVELNLRYHRPVPMGAIALVRTRLVALEKVRLHWDYQIHSTTTQERYATAQVVLVPVNREPRRILRQIPPSLQEALLKLADQFQLNLSVNLEEQ